ncbi:MAG: hypothetical protein AABY22_32640, partial [Nanoarchaeota archaeon]
MNNINFNMGQKDGIWLVIDLIRELKYDNEFCNFYMNIEKEDVVIQMMDKLEERIMKKEETIEKQFADLTSHKMNLEEEAKRVAVSRAETDVLKSKILGEL